MKIPVAFFQFNSTFHIISLELNENCTIHLQSALWMYIKGFCVWAGRRVESSLTRLLWINWVFRRNCSGTDKTTAFWASLILRERTTLCFMNPYSCRAAFRSLHTHTLWIHSAWKWEVQVEDRILDLTEEWWAAVNPFGAGMKLFDLNEFAAILHCLYVGNA